MSIWHRIRERIEDAAPDSPTTPPAPASSARPVPHDPCGPDCCTVATAKVEAGVGHLLLRGGAR